MRLDGRTALITGAGRGIGRAIAEHFAQHGAAVALVDLDASAVETVAAELVEAGGRAIALPADVADPAAAERAVRDTAERVGPVDVLVNNAGIILLKPLLELADDEWRRVLDVNLSATFYWSRAAGRQMRERGVGSIVNVSSVSAIVGSVERGPYSASKAGIVGLTRVLATELGGHGVRVNAILPGPVETKLSDDAYTPEIKAAFVDRTALGRRGRPAEIAAAALFLACDESSYVTGQSLVVDGGYLTTGLRPS